jgi:hypothetical protein
MVCTQTLIAGAVLTVFCTLVAAVGEFHTTWHYSTGAGWVLKLDVA